MANYKGRTRRLRNDRQRYRYPAIPREISLQDLIELWLTQGRVEWQKNGCLYWTGAVSNFDIPIATLPDANGQAKRRPVNRFVLEKKLGRSLPAKATVHETCNHSLCCNPAHLEEVNEPRKAHNLSVRLTSETWQRLEQFKKSTRWGKYQAWKAPTLRYVLEVALDAIENKSIDLFSGDKEEEGGEPFVLRCSDEMMERLNKYELPVSTKRKKHGSMNMLIGKLIQVGLHCLETF